MNILFVASDNYQFSGAFLSMVKLTTILKEKYGHNILVVLPYDRGENAGRTLLEENGIRSVLIRSYTWTVPVKKSAIKPRVKAALGGGYAMISISKIKKLIQEEHIDLVHINTSWTYVGANAALRAKVPFVWHLREFLEEDQQRKIMLRKKGYRLMRKADKVVAISDSIYQKYLPIISEKTLTTIFNGISPDGFYEKRDIFANNIISLVIVGGLYPHKRQMMAVQACKELVERGYGNFKLSIVGQGAMENSLREAIGDDEHIELCGSSSDTASYYHRSDIALVCSTTEAFGRVTVEAMMSGCLLIGADTAGTAELVQDGVTGLLYHCEDTHDLANKLAYAFEHQDEVRKLAQAGQTYMMQNMTAEKNAEAVNTLYDEIIASARG